MKVKWSNDYHFNKSHIGDPVEKDGVIVGYITDVTDEEVFADVDSFPEDKKDVKNCLLDYRMSFSIEKGWCG